MEKIKNLTDRQKLLIVIGFLLTAFLLFDFYSQVTRQKAISLKVEFVNTHLCKKSGDAYVETKTFLVGEPIFICTDIEMSKANASLQVSIVIHKDEVKKYEYYWWSTIYVDEKTKIIRVNTDLLPQYYCIQIKEPRHVPFETCFDVVEK